jgi:DNA-binding SARP family transcriptional activator
LLAIQLLGGFRLHRAGGGICAIQSERLVLLLAYLFLHLEAPPSRKQLAYLFWPDTSEEQARANLRNLIHQLKRVFPEIEAFFDLDGQSIRRRSEAALAVDALQFTSTLARAKRQKDDASRLRELREAVSLYHGELLPGFYEDWVLLQREELHSAFLGALIQLAKLYEDHRQYAEAIEAINNLIRNDPLNEAAYQQAMRLHALNNDRAGALQMFHTCSTVLMRELGVEPVAETKALHRQLIQSSLADSEPTPEGRRLIGRKAEWGRLRSAWQSAAKGCSTFVLILGEVGVGKTRLANELTQWVRRQGIRAAEAQCYPAEGNLPYAPAVAWLKAPGLREEQASLAPLWKKELGRLLPEQEAQETEASGGGQWQRQRLFEALARGLLGTGAPRLLVLDDAQWSDHETLEFVHYLLRFDANAPLMILATARIEELEAQHPLNQLRLDLQSKEMGIEMELAPLDNLDLAQLARDLSSVELDAQQQAELSAESEGNPFFFVELLRSGEAPDAARLPQSLRSVLARRLNQLSAPARDLVGSAAAIGREFNYRLLKNSSQMDEYTLVQALDELWSRRILKVQGETYQFSHGKLLEAAYETLTAARRWLCHRKIAEAMLAEAEGGWEVENAIVAGHFEKAGQYPQAIEQYRKAADAAQRVFANRDAISHLKRALVLFTETPGNKGSARTQFALETYELLGDLYKVLGDFVQAMTEYSEALAQTAASESLTRARLYGKLAKVASNQNDCEALVGFVDQAEEILGDPPVESELDWWHAWLEIQITEAWVSYNCSDAQGMQSTLNEIFPVVQRLGELDKLGEYYHLMQSMLLRRDSYRINDAGLQYSILALQTSRQIGHPELLTRSIFGHGFCQFLAGNLETAIQFLNEALSLAVQIGHIEQQIMCLTYLATTHRRGGDLEACQSYSEHALALCVRENAHSYVACARANLGWVAWKRNDFQQAKALSLQALEGWGVFYPLRWFGLWTLIDLALRSLQFDEGLGYARQLKAPGQQIFAQAGDDLLASAIAAAEAGDRAKSETLLTAAVDWAKENRYL